ncbi:GntR family transcriptional regulator [Streptomyces niveus]|uniref:GntR family transcriptional regulator n=1 Tax=Streptomyces niveus TaxID=193462 RepID=UPI00342697CA
MEPPTTPARGKHVANRYEQIADDLRRLITAGTWPVGERMPAEAELAARYRVSTPTLRMSLELLQSEGLIEKRHGIGNFVRRPGPRIAYASDRRLVDGQAASEVGAGDSVSLDITMVEADGRLASLLDLRVGSPLTEYVFISHQCASPRSLTRIYVPHAVASPGVPEADGSPWGDGVRELLSADGVEVVTTTERVTARFPTAEEAHTLNISTRTPVLAVERTSTDASDRVVEGAFLVLPGDRIEVLFTTRSPATATEEMETAG